VTSGSLGPRHPGCPCFGDQPRLGIDGINVYLTTEEFSLAGTEFNGDQIYAISKDDLVRQVPAPHFVHFDDLRIGGAVAGFIQPAITTGTPRAEFFLSSLDPTVTFDQRIGVWAMTNRAAVAAGNKPTLSSMVVQSEAYGIPPAAEQKGTSSTLDSGDDRMQQVQFINGSVWGELGTALTIPNDPEQRAAAAWFEVRPTTGGGVLTGATIKRQGYVAMPGNHVLYPALQTTPAGRTAMVVSVSGPNRFPSAGYAVLGPKAKEFGPVKIAAPGSTFYDPDAGRWGDYSWAVLGPNPKTVWMATEYMPPPRSQTVNRQRNWGTRVVHLLP